MNNSGHALTTSDIEAIRKAQHEWRLQKRRELETKARKKQLRLSNAAQSHPKFSHSQPAASLSNPPTIPQSHPTAQPAYARQLTPSPSTFAAPHHNPQLYPATTSAPNPAAASSQELVAQQVLRQKAIQQHTQLQQIQHPSQAVMSHQVRLQPLFHPTRETGQAPVISSAALITTSPGVSIQPQPPNHHHAARPVAPRPSLPSDINMKNAVAAAAAAANAASAAAVAMRTQLDSKAATAKATEEAAAAAAAAAHAAANASTGDPQYAAMLASSAAGVSVAKSTQEAVDAAAAAAAAAAASAAVPGSSMQIANTLDQAARIKLEQLEAQRRWREEKRRELALKRAKGAGSKRGRKRTKFVHSSPTVQEHVATQSVVAPAGGHSMPFATSVASSVAIAGTQPLTMSSGMQSQMTAVQLGVQGEFLAGGQASEVNLHSGSTGMPTTSATIVNEGHLTPEDAAAMYAHMAGAGPGGASLPMDTSGTTALPLTASGGALVDVVAEQGGEDRDQGVQDVEIPGTTAITGEAAEEPTGEGVTQGDVTATENEITKATEAAVAEASGEAEDTGVDAAQDTPMADAEQVGDAGEEGIGATSAEDGDGPGQEAVGSGGNGSERAQGLALRRREESCRQQEQAKDGTDGCQVDIGVNVRVNEMGGEDVDIKEKQNGNEREGAHGTVMNETADEATEGVGEGGETHGNEENEEVRESGGGTDGKEDDEGAQDRFQEDGGEDIMTAAAWQSLDSINP